MTLLVVDDDQQILKYLYAALSKFGYKVLTADNAHEALSILSENEVNLMIADLNMPEMDGVALCQRVRQSDQFGYIPILLLSAQSSVDDVATGFSVGADDYLTKPVRIEELLRKIQQYVM